MSFLSDYWIAFACSFVTAWIFFSHLRRQTKALEKLAGLEGEPKPPRELSPWIGMYVAGAALATLILLKVLKVL